MLRVESDGPILRLTLARPEVKNAFNDELIARLTEALSTSTEARAIVITGEGNAFCAGGDLQWMRKAASYTEEQNYEDALKLANLFLVMTRSPAVVIARVNGAAFGGGCGLVAAADVAVASEDALFAFSEVRLGLVPATISPFVLPKIGEGHARALFTTGEAFKPDRALRIGLVHEVVPANELDYAVQKKLRAILSAGPESVSISKSIATSEPMALDVAARVLARARAGQEGQEGVAAFLEKRKASFVVDL
ncbi:MAG TPA: enoyl-CoA hydratase-related protein [Fimbriimonas sp.]|nr:enoyl-CoA hydratase-related protein [Fimbriimonas sp.]